MPIRFSAQIHELRTRAEHKLDRLFEEMANGGLRVNQTLEDE